MRGGNNDVQVPYRLPYACADCGSTMTPEERRAIALGAQRAQDAQTGYCSDYCSKNQPMGFHEIKEFQKGHMALHAAVAEKDVQTIGKRHATRFLSDAYCKGVVRGQVECCNLRANHREGQIVAAGANLNRRFRELSWQSVRCSLGGLGSRRRPAGATPEVYPYEGCAWNRSATLGAKASRPKPMDTAPYSRKSGGYPQYELTMYWEIVPTRVPYCRAEWDAAPVTAWDVRLTPAGHHKLLATPVDAPARLRPGAHYTVCLDPSSDRILFSAAGATASLRRNWYLQRRRRPKCPHFAESPVPKGFAENAEGNARLTQVYFRAWTLNATQATDSIPFLGHLRGENESWEASLRRWLRRLPCAETKRHVGNFLSVYRVRPSAEADGNSDDDGADEPFVLTPAHHTRGASHPTARALAPQRSSPQRRPRPACATLPFARCWR